MTTFCTIVDTTYLNQALLSRNSFLRFHPQSSFYILVTDLSTLRLDTDYVISISKIVETYPDLAHMRQYYDIVEFSTALKPFLIHYVRILRGGRVTYVDPDTMFFSSCLEILNSYSTKGILISPHRLTPADGLLVDDKVFLKFGLYNLGFISVGEETEKFLNWWQSKLVYEATRYFGSEVFTDQKWIDLASVYYDIQICKHLGINVAPWNIDERFPERREETWFCRDGSRLVFFHFAQMSQALNQGKTTEILEKYYMKVKNRDLFFSFKELITEYADGLASIPKNGIALSVTHFKFFHSEFARKISRHNFMYPDSIRVPRFILFLVDKLAKNLEKSDFLRQFIPLLFSDLVKLRKKRFY